MHIPKLFCADCGTEMLPRKNGVGLLVVCKAGPYFKTSTDAWACHSCDRVVYSGHHLTRCVEHYDESFERVKFQDTVTVAEVQGHYVGQREDIPVPPERDGVVSRESRRAALGFAIRLAERVGHSGGSVDVLKHLLNEAKP